MDLPTLPTQTHTYKYTVSLSLSTYTHAYVNTYAHIMTRELYHKFSLSVLEWPFDETFPGYDALLLVYFTALLFFVQYVNYPDG